MHKARALRPLSTSPKTLSSLAFALGLQHRGQDVSVTGVALASSAVRTAHKVQASLIVVLTRGGATARLVAKYRPRCPFSPWWCPC